jgi:hypothetical protein
MNKHVRIITTQLSFLVCVLLIVTAAEAPTIT